MSNKTGSDNKFTESDIVRLMNMPGFNISDENDLKYLVRKTPDQSIGEDPTGFN